MRFAGKILITGLAALAAVPVQAASLEIQWKDPGEYIDIDAASTMSQERFEQRVIRELSTHIEEAAARLLPQDHVLEMTVSDVDLAGYTDYFFSADGRELRVVSDLYFPRLILSYELRNAGGEVVASGEDERVEDRTFYYFAEYHRDDPFYYEKRLIDDWFHQAFFDQIDS